MLKDPVYDKSSYIKNFSPYQKDKNPVQAVWKSALK